MNIYNPYTAFQDADYAVHAAAFGGNVELMRWLVEDRHCVVGSASSNEPLRTANGLTVLALAALGGHAGTLYVVIMCVKLINLYAYFVCVYT